jgi:hypothetical protein
MRRPVLSLGSKASSGIFTTSEDHDWSIPIRYFSSFSARQNLQPFRDAACLISLGASHELTISSAESQRGGDISRRNNRICCRVLSQEGLFAMVLYFTEVTAYKNVTSVRLHDSIHIGCAKHLANFAR